MNSELNERMNIEKNKNFGTDIKHITQANIKFAINQYSRIKLFDIECFSSLLFQSNESINTNERTKISYRNWIGECNTERMNWLIGNTWIKVKLTNGTYSTSGGFTDRQDHKENNARLNLPTK